MTGSKPTNRPELLRIARGHKLTPGGKHERDESVVARLDQRDQSYLNWYDAGFKDGGLIERRELGRELHNSDRRNWNLAVGFIVTILVLAPLCFWIGGVLTHERAEADARALIQSNTSGYVTGGGQ